MKPRFIILILILGIAALLGQGIYAVRGQSDTQPVPTFQPPTNTPSGPNSVPEATQSSTVTPSNELILSYKPGATEADIKTLIDSVNGVEVKRVPQIHVILVKVPSDYAEPKNAKAAMARSLRAQATSGGIVQKNHRYKAVTVPNDPLFNDGSQEYLGPIFFQNAWNMDTTRGTGVTIAIIDSGVQSNHPDLYGAVVAGYNFVGDNTNTADDEGHGTHVAGLAAARANNGIGIVGIASNAKIMPIKVLDSGGGGFDIDIIQGIIYAADHGAKVANLSLGGTENSESMEAAIQYAVSKGTVVVAAAGNNGDNVPFYPAAYSSVISVGSVTNYADFTLSTASDFSNYYKVDIAAPGDDSAGDYGGLISTCMNSTYCNKAGTSMASPLVAGAAAIILSAKVAANPAQVKEALTCGAFTGFADYSVHPQYYGAGLLQLDQSLNWHEGSTSCHVTLPNDNILTPTTITALPYRNVQPINVRSTPASSGDPSNTCAGGLSQTVWYQYTPTVAGPYQFSTLGSDYDTVIGVYKGQANSLIQVGCNDDYFTSGSDHSSVLSLDLNAGQLYYIMVASKTSSGVLDQQLNFTVSPGILATTKLENSAANLAYTGTWGTVANSLASGSSYAQTTDSSATVAFTTRGTNLTIGCTTSPTMGVMELWVEGTKLSDICPRTPTTKYQYLQSNIDLGGFVGTRRIVIKRNAAYTGPIGLDFVQGVMNFTLNPIAGQVDDTSLSLVYLAKTLDSNVPPNTISTTWPRTTGVVGAISNTLTSTTATMTDAELYFKFTGNTATIFRAIDPSYDDMNIYVDGNWYATVSNKSGTTTSNSVPYNIVNLSTSEHIVIVSPVTHYNPSTSTNGGIIKIDAVKVGTTTDLTLVTEQDDRAASLVYSGLWSNYPSVGSTGTPTPVAGLYFANTYKWTTDPKAQLNFTFVGSTLTVKYVKLPSVGGHIIVNIDGINRVDIDTATAISNTWTLPVLITPTKHIVTITPSFSSGSQIAIDSITAKNILPFTPAMSYITETNTGFTYTSPAQWVTTAWARFQGGYAKKVSVSGPTIDFDIIGTGILVYTQSKKTSGRMEVWVDGVQQTFTTTPTNYYCYWDNVNNVPLYPNPPYTYFELNDCRIPSGQPMIFGVPNLVPGIHHVQIRALVSSVLPAYYSATELYFDGIRVLP